MRKTIWVCEQDATAEQVLRQHLTSREQELWEAPWYRRPLSLVHANAGKRLSGLLVCLLKSIFKWDFCERPPPPPTPPCVTLRIVLTHWIFPLPCLNAERGKKKYWDLWLQGFLHYWFMWDRSRKSSDAASCRTAHSFTPPGWLQNVIRGLLWWGYFWFH